MNRSRRSGRLAAIALSALALAGCASTGVSSYVPRGADVAQYRAYSWATAEQLATGDPRLDNNPFFDVEVRANVDRQLASRGFKKTSSGTSELLVRYYASVTQRVDIVPADQEFGSCRDCTAHLYDAGTLVIDFVDVRTDQVVWRGWAETSFEGAIDNQDRMEKRIETAVARILERLPWRSGDRRG